MSNSRLLQFEQLEDRLTPAVFGNVWPDSNELTVSFVPDGTPLGTTSSAPKSQLFSYFGGNPEIWQREMLRALEVWAAQADIHVSVVPDNGDPVGIMGLVQGDPRFGDIRIGGTGLSSSQLATSVPYTPSAGTWSGEILFNITQQLTLGGQSTGYDVFTVTLHEMGHVLGLEGQVTNPSSIMFEYYTGPATGLSSVDVAEVQRLYGPRDDDRFEGNNGNDTLSDAAPLFKSGLSLNADRKLWEQASAAPVRPFLLVGDLSRNGDIDTFKFDTRRETLAMRIRVETAGLSLLQSQVSIVNKKGQILAGATASRLGESISLDFTPAPKTTYYLRIDSASSAFGVGRYRLFVSSQGAQIPREQYLALLSKLQGFSPKQARNQAVRVTSPGQLSIRNEEVLARKADFYRITLPSGNSPLRFSLSGQTIVGIAILDGKGRYLRGKVGSGSTTIDTLDLDGGKEYILAVSASASTTYDLTGQQGPGSNQSGNDTVLAGTLTSSLPQVFRGMYLPASSILEVDLTLTDRDPRAVEKRVTLALFDQAGRVIYSGNLQVGNQLSVELLLGPGAYTWRLTGGSVNGSGLGQVDFLLAGLVLSDPIGPTLVDITKPDDRLLDPLWNDGAYFLQISLVDPYGRPLPTFDPAQVVILPPPLPFP